MGLFDKLRKTIDEIEAEGSSADPDPAPAAETNTDKPLTHAEAEELFTNIVAKALKDRPAAEQALNESQTHVAGQPTNSTDQPASVTGEWDQAAVASLSVDQYEANREAILAAHGME